MASPFGCQEGGLYPGRTSQLFNLALESCTESCPKDLSLGLFRSDYMVHTDLLNSATGPQIKQVEFNTIASSFGGLASKASSLHRYGLVLSTML